MSEWATYDQSGPGGGGGYQNNAGYQQTAPPAGGYQPPPQQAPPQAAGGAGGGEWQANIATAAMAAAAGGGGQGALAQAAVGAIGGDAQAKLDQGASMLRQYVNLEPARFYFEVSNKYVRDKVLLVLGAHALHFAGPAKFKFPEAYQATTGPRQEPKYDLHAPDLYIPTMAFTTYVILNAFALGTYGEFNPDVLFNTGSSCLGLLTFEFIILRLGLMFFNTEAPPKLDIFAITGYKFVALSLLVLAHIFGLGEITILYYLKFLIVSTAQAFFLVKSLEYAMGRTAAGGAEEMVKLLRFVLGGLQIPFIFFLMP